MCLEFHIKVSGTFFIHLADVDSDGKVDFEDLNFVGSSFGQSGLSRPSRIHPGKKRGGCLALLPSPWHPITCRSVISHGPAEYGP